MERTAEVRALTTVLLDCEECTETSVMLIPPQRAPYGIVDCPRCGVTYLVSLDTRGEDGRSASPPRVTA